MTPYSWRDSGVAIHFRRMYECSNVVPFPPRHPLNAEQLTHLRNGPTHKLWAACILSMSDVHVSSWHEVIYPEAISIFVKRVEEHANSTFLFVINYSCFSFPRNCQTCFWFTTETSGGWGRGKWFYMTKYDKKKMCLHAIQTQEYQIKKQKTIRKKYARKKIWY